MNHQRIDERSLAFGRLIADRVRGDPERWIAHARTNIARWLTTCDPGVAATLGEWDAVLRQGSAAAIAVLTQTGELPTRLRQSNPFAGVLTNAERNAVLLAFAHHDPAAT